MDRCPNRARTPSTKRRARPWRSRPSTSPQDAHPVLGRPTVNVGWMSGGLNVNSVPDEARLGVDVRLVPGVDRERLIERFRKATGGTIAFEVMGASDAVWTDPDDLWVRMLQASYNP